MDKFIMVEREWLDSVPGFDVNQALELWPHKIKPLPTSAQFAGEMLEAFTDFCKDYEKNGLQKRQVEVRTILRPLLFKIAAAEAEGEGEL